MVNARRGCSFLWCLLLIVDVKVTKALFESVALLICSGVGIASVAEVRLKARTHYRWVRDAWRELRYQRLFGLKQHKPQSAGLLRHQERR